MTELDRPAPGPSATADASERTKIVHAGHLDEPLLRTINPPIQRASTILVNRAQALYDGSQRTYGRKALATRRTLERALTEMEGGLGTRLHPSGLAAIAHTLLALVRNGDRVLVAEHAYHPTRCFCDRVLRRFGVNVHYYAQQSTARDIEELVTADTRLIYLESPGSLSFRLQDVPAIAAMARTRGVLTVIDNTWAAGYLFRPLASGVDVTVQSLSKYVAGHSDIIMGSVTCVDRATLDRIDAAVDDFGTAISPEDAYLVLRSLRTLPTRLDRHGRSALTIASWLAEQPEVMTVLHPAMPSSPDHQWWRRDYSGSSGLFAAVLKPVPERAVETFVETLQLFGLGFSWGGHESLALHCDPQRRNGTVIPDFGGPLVRLHIGLEDPDDLIADLRRALDTLST